MAATLKSVEASEPNHFGHKKCIISGMHTDMDKDVKHQVLFQQIALDNTWYETVPEYYDLSCFHASSSVLVHLQQCSTSSQLRSLTHPLPNTNTPTANMLKHLNRLLTYSSFYTWKQILTMHHKFLSAVEQRQRQWDD